jgi:hypothetical protein
MGIGAIQLNGLVVIVGNYGSGKTEVTINLAIDRKNAGMQVRVADLDLVNPYFRTRAAADLLEEKGIEIALPPKTLLNADLPILSPLIAGLIRRPGELSLVDVGGDDAGATVLAALADAFQGTSYHMLQVVNPMRPYTDTVEGCLEICHRIETASGMTVNGLVGNANLMHATTPKDIIHGFEFVSRVSQESGIPLHFITAAADLIPQIDIDAISCPVLAIRRQLVPPWEKAQSINS